MHTRDPEEVGNITLHLLDSAQGHPIQTWQFRNRARVSIGRSSECDINLADAQVSRQHVELVYSQSTWTIHSHGRNGTFINGVMVCEAELGDRAIFQLGSSGPSFQCLSLSDSISTVATLDGSDPAELDFLEIDHLRREEEVRNIVDGQAFQELQQQARRLKSDDGATREKP
jgi:pSer/pThr/pTyr-binding forkhead associated (FHA) protein